MRPGIPPDQTDQVQAPNNEVLEFRALYDRYHRLIFKFCLGFVRIPHLSEEATADVFIKLWEKREIFKHYSQIEPLIYKIARDTAFNYLKKIARDMNQREKYIQLYDRQSKTVEQKFLEKEDYTLLSNMIETLPDRRKVIFKMRYLEGKDNQTIAKQLHISLNTVKVQLNKGKHALKKQLLTHPGFSSLLSLVAMLFYH